MSWGIPKTQLVNQKVVAELQQCNNNGINQQTKNIIHDSKLKSQFVSFFYRMYRKVAKYMQIR